MKRTKKQMRKAFLYCLSTLFFLFFYLRVSLAIRKQRYIKTDIHQKKKHFIYLFS